MVAMHQGESQISDRVRQALADKSISGSELARRIGATQSYVSRRLNGDVPWRASDLGRIARVIDVPVAELIEPSQAAA